MSARQLVAFEKMPERETSADRIAHAHDDVTTAAAKAKARIMSNFADKGYSTTGWTVDEDGWELATAGRMVVVTGRITRE